MHLLFLLLFFVGLVGVVYFLIRRQPKNSLFSIGLSIISFIMFGITVPPSDDSEVTEQNPEETQVADNDENVEEVSEDEPEEGEGVTEENNPDEDIEEEPEPETESDPEEAPFELIDGVAVFTDTREIVFGLNSHLDIFSADMTDLLKENHQNIDNGAIFRSLDTLTDEYGNEERTITVVVYYSQETIEAINYDNWPTLDASGLYDTADGTWVHAALSEGNVENNPPSNSEEVPEIYYTMMGTVIEE